MNLLLQQKGMYEMAPAIMASIIPEAVVTDPGTISAAQVGTVPAIMTHPPPKSRATRR